MLGGRALHGRSGVAGEIGHVSVDEHGPVCRCGNRGCLEMLVGAPSLLAMLPPEAGHLTLADLVTRARDGDAGSRRVVFDAGRHLGVALANLCNLVDPDVVVIGGTLAEAGDLLLEPLRTSLGQRVVATSRGPVEVVPSALGADAGVRGALAAALDQARMFGSLGVGS
ncbi:ROK family protein [Promicromonospora sp. Populi]|uniref:ROK family protein n=1 Tax=Promicromonospora sp. Populi TaxID=3239420 RepID=UPI0034E29167